MSAVIHVAWMEFSPLNAIAEPEFYRLWHGLEDQPKWTSWLEAHIKGNDLAVMVQFEERSKLALRRHRDTLIYYVPMTWIDLATENATLDQLGTKSSRTCTPDGPNAEIFPPPPTDNIDVPEAGVAPDSPGHALGARLTRLIGIASGRQRVAAGRRRQT